MQGMFCGGSPKPRHPKGRWLIHPFVETNGGHKGIRRNLPEISEICADRVPPFRLGFRPRHLVPDADLPALQYLGAGAGAPVGAEGLPKAGEGLVHPLAGRAFAPDPETAGTNAEDPAAGAFQAQARDQQVGSAGVRRMEAAKTRAATSSGAERSRMLRKHRASRVLLGQRAASDRGSYDTPGGRGTFRESERVLVAL